MGQKANKNYKEELLQKEGVEDTGKKNVVRIDGKEWNVNNPDAPFNRRKKRKRLTLTDANKVRTYIQQLMVMVENGEMDLNTARLLSNQAEIILKAINQRQEEERLIELEERLKDLEDENQARGIEF